MEIRLADVKDIAAIQRIAHETWPSTYGAIIGNEQIDYMLNMMYSDAALNEQMQQGHKFYIVSIDDNAFGFASVSNEGEGIFKLNKLYVIPLTQKTGAGKALYQTVVDYAKNNGGKQLQLQVNKHNNAKTFYEKMGFSVLREAILDIGHGYVMDDYIMGIEL